MKQLYTVILFSLLFSLVGKCAESELCLSASKHEPGSNLLEVTLKNESSTPIIVPVILIPEYTYFSLKVFTPDDVEIRGVFPMFDYREGVLDLVILRPLDSYTSRINLDQYFPSGIPDASRIVVSYNLKNMHPRHLELSTWSGVLSAETTK